MNYNNLLEYKRNDKTFYAYTYELNHGKENLFKNDKKVDLISEKGFTTSGYGYVLPYEYFGQWRMRSWSSNAYRYEIFLGADGNINDYLSEIKEEIATRILNEINCLQSSLNIIQNCQ